MKWGKGEKGDGRWVAGRHPKTEIFRQIFKIDILISHDLLECVAWRNESALDCSTAPSHLFFVCADTPKDIHSTSPRRSDYLAAVKYRSRDVELRTSCKVISIIF